MDAKIDEWLRSEIVTFVNYHNHKEKMAWTATALFLAGGAAFLSAPPRLVAENKTAATIVLVLVTLAIMAFVIMQFCMRWNAADTCEGLRASLTKLYTPDPAANLCWHLSTDRGFPQFVATEIANVATNKRRFRKGWYKDPRWRSEIPTYMTILLTSVVLVAAMWNPPAHEKNKFDALASEVATLSVRINESAAELRRAVADSETRLRKHIESQQPRNNQRQRTPR